MSLYKPARAHPMSMNFNYESDYLASLQGARSESEQRSFRILVVGDFSGRASRSVAGTLSDRPIYGVEIDTLESLPKQLGTRVHCSHAEGVEVDVLTFEGLHPDQLYQTNDVFTGLRKLRKRLLDPSTYEDARAEVRGWAEQGTASSSIESKPDQSSPEPSQPGSDFASLLEADRGSVPSKPASSVDELVRRIVAPYVVPAENPDQARLVATVDQAIAGQMNAILHDPAWQSVEAAWRSLQLLATSLELGDSVTLSVLDASREELEAELDAGSPTLQNIIADPSQTWGGEPWSLLISLETFGPSDHDANILSRLATLAYASGAPLIAGASPQMLGIDSIAGQPDPQNWSDETSGGGSAQAWADLRGTTASQSVGLVCPRFLLRMPYGKKTDPIDSFGFEEAQGMAHEDYLWGNGAALVALILGQAIPELGWRIQPSGSGEVTDLPVHALPDGTMKPCAEAWLTDRAASTLLGMNLIPVLSVQNRGAVRVGPLTSIAGAMLASSWG